MYDVAQNKALFFFLFKINYVILCRMLSPRLRHLTVMTYLEIYQRRHSDFCLYCLEKGDIHRISDL